MFEGKVVLTLEKTYFKSWTFSLMKNSGNTGHVTHVTFA